MEGIGLMNEKAQFWQDRPVFITGATGLKNVLDVCRENRLRLLMVSDSAVLSGYRDSCLIATPTHGGSDSNSTFNADGHFVLGRHRSD